MSGREGRKEVTFDFTVNIGNLLTITTFVGSFIYFIFKVGSRVDVVSGDVNDLKDNTKAMGQELKKLTEVLIVQGRQDERITAMDQRMVNQGKRLDDTIRRLNTYLDMRAANAADSNDD